MVTLIMFDHIGKNNGRFIWNSRGSRRSWKRC